MSPRSKRPVEAAAPIHPSLSSTALESLQEAIQIDPNTTIVEGHVLNGVYMLSASHLPTTFCYRRVFDVDQNTDTIYGFVAGQDKIDLRDLFASLGGDMGVYNVNVTYSHDSSIEIYVNDGPSGKYGNDYHIATLKNVPLVSAQKKALLRLVVNLE